MTLQVIIHFGPPKTGSSSIQHWLTSHREQLRQDGIYYPAHATDINDVSSGNVRALFNIRGNTLTFSPAKYERVCAKALKQGSHTLLLSSEFFMRQLTVLAEHIPEAKYIGFVRSPLDALESTYNQGVKRNGNAQPLKYGFTARAPILDIVQSAVEKLGKDSFCFSPFDPAFFPNGNLIAEFLALAGINNYKVEDTKKINTSYCFEALEVKRWFNKFNIDGMQHHLDEFLQGYDGGINQFSLIKPDDYGQLRELYLARTEKFIQVCGCKYSDEYLQLLAGKPQKDYRPQKLNQDTLQQVIGAWLQQDSKAKGYLTNFVEHAIVATEEDRNLVEVIKSLLPRSVGGDSLGKLVSSVKHVVDVALQLRREGLFTNITRSGENKLSFASAFDKAQFHIEGKTAPIHTRVEWISHHIPKTAGSSLRFSLGHAYKKRAIYGIYKDSGAKQLNRGENIWLPKEAKIIHGHFHTHVNQYDYFPNAKRMVWVRDPIERAWSLLGRLLDIKHKDSLYTLLKSRYIDQGISDKAKLFECFVTDNELNKSLFAYQRYFKQIPIDQFDFVGSMHTLNQDIARLSDVLGIKLQSENKNKRTGAKDLPSEIRRLENLFADEYEIVGKYLNNNRPL
jgi:hypothetical protein